MASTKRFVKNTAIYFVGSFATKLLQFLLIPIYTKYITPSDLGDFNVIVASVSLCLPLLFQSIWEGAFRFAIEKEDNGRTVLSTSTIYCLSLSILYSILFIFISYYVKLDLAWYILIYALSHIFSSYWQFSARALKENSIYATSAVINSAISIALNCILIIGFNQGIKSLLIANTVGTIVMVLILENRLNLLRDISLNQFNQKLLKNILKYSIPLAINSVSWWLFTSCNNYIITGVMGSSANGIYAMAIRFGTILSTVTSIISLAWNEEAFRSYSDSDRDIYFNKILNLLISGLLCIVMIFIPITYLAYNWFVFGEYKSGVILTPYIYLGAVINALCCHLGSALLARKESNILFITTFGGGALSLLASFVLLHWVGLIGAVIGSLFGYLFIYYVRIPLLHKRMDLKINHKKMHFLFFLCIAVGIISNKYQHNIGILVSITVLTILIFCILNKVLVIQILKRFTKK